MELLGLFTTSFLIGISGALVPGPLFTVTIKESLQKGLPLGFLPAVGHVLLELLLIIVLVLGLHTFLASAEVSGVIGVSGGLVLIWMGYGIIKNSRNFTLSYSGEDDEPKNNPALIYSIGSLGLGVLATGTNPYWVLWWATIGVGYLLVSSQFGWLGILSFYSGHILADLGWFGLVAIGVAKGKKLFPIKIYHNILVGCGIFLIFFAGYFIYNGLNFWLS